MSLSISLASLFVKTFVKILKEKFSKLMGLNFFIDLASFSFGIRVIIAKFNLNKSRWSLNHALNIAMRSSLMISELLVKHKGQAISTRCPISIGSKNSLSNLFLNKNTT
jgi:hypothetical protein